MSYEPNRQPSKAQRKVPWGKVIIAAIIAAVVIGALYFVFGFWQDTDARFWQWMYQWVWLDGLFPNGWNVFRASWLTYSLLGAAIAAVGWISSSKHRRWLIAAGIIIAVVNATVFPMWLNNMLGSAGMSEGTSVTIEDFDNPPPALRELLVKAEGVDDDTMRTNVRGYTTTIEAQAIDLQWETRPASAKGAEIVMRSSGDSDTNSYLMGETLSFHANGSWSAIRDGQNYKPIAGVSVWDGVSNDVQTCRFDGANELNYAFNGLWGKNLMDLIVSRYPRHLIDRSDVWGDCDNEGAPLIVIPTTIREGYG